MRRGTRARFEVLALITVLCFIGAPKPAYAGDIVLTIPEQVLSEAAAVISAFGSDHEQITMEHLCVACTEEECGYSQQEPYYFTSEKEEPELPIDGAPEGDDGPVIVIPGTSGADCICMSEKVTVCFTNVVDGEEWTWKVFGVQVSLTATGGARLQGMLQVEFLDTLHYVPFDVPLRLDHDETWSLALLAPYPHQIPVEVLVAGEMRSLGTVNLTPHYRIGVVTSETLDVGFQSLTVNMTRVSFEIKDEELQVTADLEF